MSGPGERIVLTFPADRRLVGIVGFFVGGLATRLDLGYEAMDDLELAVESVLRSSPTRGRITLEACVDGGALSIRVGPFDRDPLRPDESHPEAIELQRLLTALVAGSESVTDAAGCWLRLDVGVAAGSGSA